jgi:hypothetical protein
MAGVRRPVFPEYRGSIGRAPPGGKRGSGAVNGVRRARPSAAAYPWVGSSTLANRSAGTRVVGFALIRRNSAHVCCLTCGLVERQFHIALIIR